MATTLDSEQLHPNTLDILRELESQASEKKRADYIIRLGKTPERDTCRILIELWGLSMWRETKKAILHALGLTGQQRAIEFLIGIANDAKDLDFAGRAILALGKSGSPSAGEYLLGCMLVEDHPLLQQILISLSDIPLFDCSEELIALLGKADLSVSVRQYVVLALSKQVSACSWSDLYRATIHNSRLDSTLVNGLLLAASNMGCVNDIPAIEALNCQGDFFSEKLRKNCIDRIYSKSEISVDIALQRAIDANTREELDDAISWLGEFEPEHLYEHVDSRIADVEMETFAAIRSSIADSRASADDLSFLKKYSGEVSPEIIAAITRRNLKKEQTEFVKKLETALPRLTFLKSLNYVKTEHSIALGRDWLRSNKLNKSETIEMINVLISQALMFSSTPKKKTSIKKILIEFYRKTQDDGVKNRTLRAIGQLAIRDDNFLKQLESDLDQNPGLIASIYGTLGAIGSKDCAKLILVRIQSGKVSKDDFVHALRALARCKLPPDLSALTAIPKEVRISSGLSLLQILSRAKVDGFEGAVSGALASTHHLNLILGIASAKYNHNQAILDKLGEFLMASEPSIVGRSIDSLAWAGSVREYNRLLDWLREECNNEEFAIKILQSIRPRPQTSYGGLIAKIEGIIGDEGMALRTPFVLQQAQNLLDHLTVSQGPTHQHQKLHEIHHLDQGIGREIETFENIPPMVKAVIRNAELTWGHPDLFNELVDKSTVVIEFTKSIDLLLQEKIGTMMFMGGSEEFLSQMQTRIVKLDLHDRSVQSADRIQILSCDDTFSPDEFPNHKLWLICDSIMTGRIISDQYKIIDGLRAWSLLLLVFARPFESRNQAFPPIFSLRGTRNQVNRLAKQMNHLQHIRNQAAHRGTLLEATDIKGIRNQSLRVFNELYSILDSSGC